MTRTNWGIQEILGAVLLPVAAFVIAGMWIAAESKAKPMAGEVLLAAAEKGDEAAVLRSLASGTPVNCVERGSGMTPLMYAAARGQVSVARVLLSRGGDVRAFTDGCGTALAHAARDGRKVEMIRLLLEHGADPNACEPFGFTPLMHAVAATDLAAAEALMLGGAKVDAADKFGQTIFTIAAASEDETLLARLKALVARHAASPKRRPPAFRRETIGLFAVVAVAGS